MHTRTHKQQKKALEAYLQAPASQNTWVIHDNARLGIFCFKATKFRHFLGSLSTWKWWDQSLHPSLLSVKPLLIRLSSFSISIRSFKSPVFSLRLHWGDRFQVSVPNRWDSVNKVDKNMCVYILIYIYKIQCCYTNCGGKIKAQKTGLTLISSISLSLVCIQTCCREWWKLILRIFPACSIHLFSTGHTPQFPRVYSEALSSFFLVSDSRVSSSVLLRLPPTPKALVQRKLCSFHYSCAACNRN